MSVGWWEQWSPVSTSGQPQWCADPRPSLETSADPAAAPGSVGRVQNSTFDLLQLPPPYSSFQSHSCGPDDRGYGALQAWAEVKRRHVLTAALSSGGPFDPAYCRVAGVRGQRLPVRARCTGAASLACSAARNITAFVLINVSEFQ